MTRRCCFQLVKAMRSRAPRRSKKFVPKRAKLVEDSTEECVEEKKK
jgi:hypothetical protein